MRKGMMEIEYFGGQLWKLDGEVRITQYE